MFKADRPPLIMPETPCVNCPFRLKRAIGRAITALTLLAEVTKQPIVPSSEETVYKLPVGAVGLSTLFEDESIDVLWTREDAFSRGKLYGLNKDGVDKDSPYSIASTIYGIANACPEANLNNNSPLLQYALEVVSVDRSLEYHEAIRRYCVALALLRKQIEDPNEKAKIRDEIHTLSSKTPKQVLGDDKRVVNRISQLDNPVDPNIPVTRKLYCEPAGLLAS